MTLSAYVFCNCYELGKLREPPPYPEYIEMSEDGGLDFDWKNWVKDNPGEKFDDFFYWLEDRACEHKDMRLLQHGLANITLASNLRKEFRHEAEKFPIILEKIIYTGTHGGDWLTLEEVEQLKPELEVMAQFRCTDPEMIPYMEYFRQQMIELVEASLSVSKPICF